MNERGTPAAYFDAMYAGSDDPWNFETNWYDRRKHALTVACLPRQRYRSAFEPGCSTGMLTALLADRCDRLLAVDTVAGAVSTAGKRLTDRPHVTVEQRRLPGEWPTGRFDLIVLSELGYYFGDDDLALLLRRTVDALEPGGCLVAVHWRWPAPDHARGGDDVHRAIGALAGIERTTHHTERDFVLEVFTRVPPAARSVAQDEGLC